MNPCLFQDIRVRVETRLICSFVKVFTFFRAFLFAYGGIVAAKRLHNQVLKAILRAPVSFFDVTPVSIG